MTSRRNAIDDLFSDFQAIRRKLAEHALRKRKDDLPPSQWLALKTVYLSEGGAGIKDIAQALSVSSSAATQTVNALQKKGYVRRRDDPRDRRNVRLTLSPMARRAIAAMRSRAVAQMSRVFDSLTDAEFARYRSLTRKIASRLSSDSASSHAEQ
jgi:DNA-binding MarR family transcriptional regulator